MTRRRSRRRSRYQPIHAEAVKNQTDMICLEAPVQIAAAEAENPDGPRKFDVVAYTGGAVQVAYYDLPVVIDLAGLAFRNNLVANLDHNRSQRVGHVTEVVKENGQLKMAGFASAHNPARDEVVLSAKDGYVWQASVEVLPSKIVEVAAGKEVSVNGQTFTGPIYVTRKGTLKGFAFVSHGADDNTTVNIAAEAADQEGDPRMDPQLKEWIEAMGFVVADLSAPQLAALEANYKGQNAAARRQTKPEETQTLDDIVAAQKAEQQRIRSITDIAARFLADYPTQVESIESMSRLAVEAQWAPSQFELELHRATRPQATTVIRRRGDERMNNRVVEAAICMAGRLAGHEQMYDDQTLQTAHDRFRGGIGLKQLFLMCAADRGWHGNYASQVNLEVQRAAFGMTGPQQISAAGFSTLDISTIVSNTANKFLRAGWEAVDMTPMRIAFVRPVNDFKTITTVSLTGDLQFEKLGASGEIKHGTLGEETYTNKADTYARMLAITRQDIVNDDLAALTQVPRRLGRGAALKLNDIFWMTFLNNSSFFTSARANVNEAVADMTVGGLAATDTVFMDQTDPDGKPLGIMPQILLVPTALKSKALALMTSEKIKGDADEPDGNVWRGRFRVESSPYMSNSSYTGYSAAAWYLLADPQELPVVEIVALNGRVEPVVETADAEFNVLGVQMRGYSDVGVALQEYRAGVRADGGSS